MWIACATLALLVFIFLVTFILIKWRHVKKEKKEKKIIEKHIELTMPTDPKTHFVDL